MVRDLDKMFITLLGNDSASQSFSHISMVGVFGTCPIHIIVINFFKIFNLLSLNPIRGGIFIVRAKWGCVKITHDKRAVRNPGQVHG